MLGSFLEDLVDRAVRALERAGVRYALCGGVALVLSGRDRSTRDLDAVADFDSNGLRRLIDTLREEGFSHHDRADRHPLEGVILHRFWLPVRDTGLSASFDLQQANDAFYRDVVSHARKVSLRGREVRVAALEDLILLKLAAYRPIDRADAIELLLIGDTQVDLAVLEQIAEKLGIGDRLRDAVTAARQIADEG